MPPPRMAAKLPRSTQAPSHETVSTPRDSHQPIFIEAKLLVADGSWSVIGSAKTDNRSRKLNDEVARGFRHRVCGAARTSHGG